MFRHWRIAGAVLCGLFFLAIFCLWISSFFLECGIRRQKPTGIAWIGVSNGHIGFSSQNYSMPLLSGDGKWRLYYGGVGRIGWWDALIGFSWRHFNTNFKANGGQLANMRFRNIWVPMWALLFLYAPLPIWVYFRGRRKVRWSMRDDIAWMNFRLKRKLRRFAIFSIAGIVAGAGLGWFDNQFRLWQTTEEWLLALLVLIPIVNFLVIFTRRRIPWGGGLLWMSLEFSGFICFFIATLQESWRILGGLTVPDVNLAPGALLMGGIGFVLSAIILLLLQLRPKPFKPGPYCPACGYCLIGSPRRICAECGRAFTLEELGVSEEELNPKSKLEIRRPEASKA